MCLILNNLNITFAGQTVVRDVSFNLPQGGSLGIIGESGSGKTMLAKALMGLVPQPGVVTVESLRMFEKEYYNNTSKFAAIRGKNIAMVTQDPMLALNPIMQVGKQIAEAACIHQRLSQQEAMAAAHAMLIAVKIPDPDRVLRCYPHQLSGGMAQRVLLAMMLACKPQVLIADEVTSALDASTRHEIMALIKELAVQNNMSTIMISHDIHQVVAYCQNILVLWRGQVVENTAADDLINSQHPYTQALLNCLPTRSKRGTPLPEIAGYAHAGN